MFRIMGSQSRRRTIALDYGKSLDSCIFHFSKARAVEKLVLHCDSLGDPDLMKKQTL